MDEIEQRLRETADACIKSYESWRAKEKDSNTREALQEAVHELRKVASRLEIEIAISERGEMSEKPLPIPPHRSSRRGRTESILDDDDNVGNADPSSAQGQQRGGGRSGGGRGRRPQKQQG